MAYTLGCTLPPHHPGAARGSSMRALVQEPRKTRSMAMSSIAVPARSPMYSRARSAARWSASSANDPGSGTRPVTGTTIPGLVPQVTKGASAPSKTSTRS